MFKENHLPQYEWRSQQAHIHTRSYNNNNVKCEYHGFSWGRLAGSSYSLENLRTFKFAAAT